MAKLFANSGDPDQTPHTPAFDRGLHCLRVTLLMVSRLKWVILSLHMTLANLYLPTTPHDLLDWKPDLVICIY